MESFSEEPVIPASAETEAGRQEYEVEKRNFGMNDSNVEAYRKDVTRLMAESQDQSKTPEERQRLHRAAEDLEARKEYTRKLSETIFEQDGPTKE